MLTVTLVVPCFNEAERLDPDRFRDRGDEHAALRFVLVDDGSSDQTLEILQDLEDHDGDRFRVLHLPENVGKAEAVREGLLAALEGGPDLVGYWDADLATPLHCVTDFVRVLEEYPAVQLVMGSRVRLLGRHIQRRALRHYAGRVFATMVSLALDLPVYDTQCGAKLLRCAEWTPDLLVEPFTSRWIFDVEIIFRMKKIFQARGEGDVEQAIYELPLTTWIDAPGSKVRWYDFFRATVDLLVTRRRYS